VTEAPAILVRGLRKSFGQVRAVDGLDLAVHPGQVYGLLGPNGAGKTTTIRCLLRYLHPDAGEVRVLGSDARDPAVRRRIGYLPSDPGLDLRMRADALLRWYGRLRGGVPDEDVAALCRRLDLDASRRIGELSRGNRQKVAVVQAFLHRPDVVVMDEATSGLDPLVQREVLRLIDEHRARGVAFLFSSHVLPEVEEIADVVGILRQGALVVEDSVAGLLSRAHQRLDITMARSIDPQLLAAVPGVLAATATEGSTGQRLHVQIEGSAAEAMRVLAPLGITRIDVDERELDEVFFGFYEQVRP
jgi:ABC-2 type transport system ATP-binding protein